MQRLTRLTRLWKLTAKNSKILAVSFHSLQRMCIQSIAVAAGQQTGEGDATPLYGLAANLNQKQCCWLGLFGVRTFGRQKMNRYARPKQVPTFVRPILSVRLSVRVKFKIIQGHRSWCRSKAHMRPPISHLRLFVYHESLLPDAVLWRHYKSKMADGCCYENRYVDISQWQIIWLWRN